MFNVEFEEVTNQFCAEFDTVVHTGDATLGEKTITANGVYNASSDDLDGYSKVTANVPNTYAASDEGKVVSSGALVAQTAHADVTPTTSDQTIDTTTNNSIKVKGDADLVAGNIKKDVEIFGVTGSYEGGGGGLSEEVKQALLDLFQHMAYTDADGQDYYDALYNAFYPPAELTIISAVYTQSGSVFPDTPLDDLKDDLVVTAHYSDSTTEVVPSADYTLSGTLTAGTSTVTVTYEDKTTTFNVTVSEPAVLSSITAVYTQSGVVYPTDSLDSLKPDLVVTAHYSDSSTATVTTYTLSGSLTVGTSTITVTYSGKTTTFNVTVTESPYLAIWEFTQSLVDEIDGNTFVLTQENANGTLTRTSDGIVFTGYGSAGDTNTHDDAAKAVSDTEVIFPWSTLAKIEFGDITPNFYTNAGTAGSIYALANGLLVDTPLQLFWRGASDKFSGWIGGGWRDDCYKSVAPNYFANKTVEMAVNFLGGGIIKTGDEVIAEIPAGAVTISGANGYTMKFGRSGGQAFHDATIRKVTIEELPAEQDVANISVPLKFKTTASGDSWNTQTKVLTVHSGGASNYPNGTMQNLACVYSNIDDAVFRFSATVTISGIGSSYTGSGAIIAAGLYTSANPPDSGSTNRKASKTIWHKLENGTFTVEYESLVSEMFTGTSLGNYYLGLSFMMNAQAGATGVLSNIVAEVVPNVSI